MHVQSSMAPPEMLLDFDEWLIRPVPRASRGNRSVEPAEWRAISVEKARAHGNGLVALLDQIGDRDAAARLTGMEIGLPRASLPSADPDEFYWVDLIGGEVVTLEGDSLGRVVSFMETGAHDVMVVQDLGTSDRSAHPERLIPFVMGAVVKEVELERPRIVVEWDPDD